jgi:hypothetical protein
MTSAFLTKLVLEDEGDGVRMTLAQPLIYRSTMFSSEIVVPVTFCTDFASIPQFLWNILPQHGRYDRGAVLHDQAYQLGAVNGQPITRAQADALFGEAMTVAGVPRWQRWMILAGLKIGGHGAWKRYRATERTTTPVAEPAS